MWLTCIGVASVLAGESRGVKSAVCEELIVPDVVVIISFHIGSVFSDILNLASCGSVHHFLKGELTPGFYVSHVGFKDFLFWV